MKTKNLCLLALATTAASLTTIAVNQVNAATITYDLEVNNLDGSLSGDSFTGSFSFDDDSLLGSGDDFISIDNLSFDFLGTTYTENDDNSAFGAEAAFFNGEFLGLSYSTDVSFSFVPGFFSLSDSFFAYDLGSGDVGTGDLVYNLQSTNPNPVPEPATVIGLLTTAILGNNLRKNK